MKIGETEVARLIRLVRFSRMTELIGHLAAFFRSGMFPTIMGIVKIMAGSLSMKAVAAQVSISEDGCFLCFHFTSWEGFN